MLTPGMLRARVRFWRETDRIGPDIPLTHWRLHFKPLMTALCRARFATFGDDAEVRPGAYVVNCSRVHLGRRVVIRPGCMLHASPWQATGEIVIEDDVMLGSGVHIYVDKHRFDDPSRPIIDQGDHVSERVVLESGCWIGANAVVLPGVTVGRGAVVGAGSIVTRSVAAHTLVAGNPARLVRSFASSREASHA